MKYIIYGQQGCKFCVLARNLLIEKGMTLSYINILNNPDARHFVVEEEGHKTVPQIYTRDALGIMNHIGGYEDLQNHLKKT